MRIEYRLADGELHMTRPGRGNVVIFADPTPEERQEILKTLPLEEHTLDSMLDPDEISRAEFEPESNVVIWKRTSSNGANDHFPVSSVGLVLQPDRLTVIERERSPLPGDVQHHRPSSLVELMLRGMQGSVVEFVHRLRLVKEASREMQVRLTRTLDNSELLRMFDLSESLVFAVDAVDANATVLRRLAAAAPKLGFTEKEIGLLEDITIDNAQLSRQGHLYITIFGGLMDARGNIINNNMNVLLKNLMLVNVVFLPLGVIAGMGGMSEFSRFLDEHRLDFLTGYFWFTLVLSLFGLGLWAAIALYISRFREARRPSRLLRR
jgi:magnesium transporter